MIDPTDIVIAAIIAAGVSLDDEGSLENERRASVVLDGRKYSLVLSAEED